MIYVLTYNLKWIDPQSLHWVLSSPARSMSSLVAVCAEYAWITRSANWIPKGSDEMLLTVYVNMAFFSTHNALSQELLCRLRAHSGSVARLHAVFAFHIRKIPSRWSLSFEIVLALCNHVFNPRLEWVEVFLVFSSHVNHDDIWITFLGLTVDTDWPVLLLLLLLRRL